MLSTRISQKINSANLDTERYSIVASFLNYENTVLVQRNSLYLLANATLLAPAWEPIHKLLTCTYSRQISDLHACASEQSMVSVIVFGLSVVGLLLSLLWLHSARASDFWIHHWRKHLRKLERKAFGGHRLHRDFVSDGYPFIWIKATLVLKLTIYLFMIVWLILVSSIIYLWNCWPFLHFMIVVIAVPVLVCFFREIYCRCKHEYKACKGACLETQHFASN